MPAPTLSHGKRPLGRAAATALVVGNMVGAGVFLLPSALAPFGGLSLVALLGTAVGAVLLALVFARLSAAYPAKGGPYVYARRAFGDAVGFLTAWGYWIAVWVANAAIALAFSGYLGYFVPAVADHLWLGASVAVLALWVLTAVNVLGLRAAGAVQVVVTVLKVVPLLLVGVAGVFSVTRATFSPFNPTGGTAVAGITAAAALALWAFVGLESATVPADEVEHAEHTVPRATVFGTAAAALVTIVATVGVMALVPLPELGQSSAPFADAANRLFGSWGGGLVAAGGLLATFGALNGWILLQAQVPKAAADDGLFPRWFGTTTRTGLPLVGLVVSSALTTLLLATHASDSLLSLFTRVVLIATLARLVPYLVSSVAQIRLLFVDRVHFVGAHFFRDGTIAFVALLFAAWTLYAAGREVALWGAGLYALGVPVYFWLLDRRERDHLDRPIEGDRTVLEIHEAGLRNRWPPPDPDA